MVRVTHHQRPKRKQSPPQPPPAPRVSEQQAITVLAWLQARHPKAVAGLLKQHGVSVPVKVKPRKLNTLLHKALHTKGRKFHAAVERLTAQKVPSGQTHDAYMSQGEQSSELLGAAAQIGGSTRSGAAGGGWVGAALGLGEGVTKVIAKGQEKKLQAEAQRQSMFQTLVSMRNQRNSGGANNNGGGGTKTILLIGGVLVVVAGLAFAFWKATRPPAIQSSTT